MAKEDYIDFLFRKWDERFADELPSYENMSPEDQKTWKTWGAPISSRKSYEAQKKRNESINKWYKYFKLAGFDKYDIDFSDVDPEAITAMGKALAKLYEIKESSI